MCGSGEAGRAAYRGRLAPTPSGFLHAGHAATFWTAFQRAEAAGGTLALRIEDLDPVRCRQDFAAAAIEDLEWLGIRWTGDPVYQSSRRQLYLDAWKKLRDGGWIYPCRRSRKDVAGAGLAPHGDEPIFPIKWRPDPGAALAFSSPGGVNWRFRVPDGESLRFVDGNLGPVEKISQLDFGDFIVWNRDDVPAYELAVVVDDLAMRVTEVVRGADLITSTARQLLIIRALEAVAPLYFHCPLLVDEAGRRLSKRGGSPALRELRAARFTTAEILASK